MSAVAFTIKALYGDEIIRARLADITAVYPEEGVIYIDGIPCDLESAQPVVSEVAQ